MNELQQSKILKLEGLQAILDSDFPAANVSYSHYFADGMYCRVMFIPAGTMAVGAIHKHEHLAMLARGSVMLVDGKNPPIRIDAGFIQVSQPGTKRAVFALEDSVFMNVQRLENPDERDLGKIWDECVSNTLDDYMQFIEHKEEKPCLSQQ